MPSKSNKAITKLVLPISTLVVILQPCLLGVNIKKGKRNPSPQGNIPMDCVLEQLNTAVCMLPSIDSYPNAVLACSMKDKALVQIYMNWDIISIELS